MSNLSSLIDADSAYLLPEYKQKWRNLTLSTQPINIHQARTAVERAYQFLGYSKPSLLFFASPFAALPILVDLRVSGQFGQLLHDLRESYFDLYFQAMFNVHHAMYTTYPERERLYNRYMSWEHIRELLSKVYKQLIFKKITATLSPENSAQALRRLSHKLLPLNCCGNYCSGKIELWSGALDFSISVLGYGTPRQWEQWQIIKTLILSSGWIFALEGIALVCARPITLNLNQEDVFQSEKKAVIAYADGVCIYTESSPAE